MFEFFSKFVCCCFIHNFALNFYIFIVTVLQIGTAINMPEFFPFRKFADAGIFPKWLWIAFWSILNLFDILSLEIKISILLILAFPIIYDTRFWVGLMVFRCSKTFCYLPITAISSMMKIMLMSRKPFWLFCITPKNIMVLKKSANCLLGIDNVLIFVQICESIFFLTFQRF